jgi:hypothetical protein
MLMKYSQFWIGSGLAALLAAVPAFALTDLPMDKPTTVAGIETVCTGVGSSGSDPRWAAYPLKVVVSGKGGVFLADADLTVARDGKRLLAVHCGGPWLLLKLPAGHYSVTAVVSGQSASTTAVVPASGQGRAVLRLPRIEG